MTLTPAAAERREGGSEGRREKDRGIKSERESVEHLRQSRPDVCLPPFLEREGGREGDSERDRAPQSERENVEHTRQSRPDYGPRFSH